MYGFIEGITDTDNINFCPKCGNEIFGHYGDATAKCKECGFHFGVVELEEGEDGEK